MPLNCRQRSGISCWLICGARQAEAVLREFPLSSGTGFFMGAFFQIYLRLFIYGIQMWVTSEVSSRHVAHRDVQEVIKCGRLIGSIAISGKR
jgi:hypothetical protein